MRDKPSFERKKIMLTDLEKKLLPSILVSTFNGDRIDLNKDWAENSFHFENEDYFESIVDTKIFSRWSGMDVPTIKGVIGSLVKKGLITLVEDIDSDDRPMNWLLIYQNQFDLIKQAVAE